jgi:ParB-like nuclease domain
MVEIVQVPLSAIRLDGGTQPRVEPREDRIEEYAEDMQRGDVFPAITLFHDGSDYWLADGFTRVGAAKLVGLETIVADVRHGTLRDALRFTLSVNRQHGDRRTNADKRMIVLRAFADPEWRRWSDNRTASECGVSQKFVSNLRSQQAQNLDTKNGTKYPRNETTYIHPRTGQPTQMATRNIGRRPDGAPTPAPAPEPVAEAEAVEEVEEAEEVEETEDEALSAESADETEAVPMLDAAIPAPEIESTAAPASAPVLLFPERQAGADDAGGKAKTPDEPLYVCDCGEMFAQQVWHCRLCSAHWLLERDECWNCDTPRGDAPVATLVCDEVDGDDAAVALDDDEIADAGADGAPDPVVPEPTSARPSPAVNYRTQGNSEVEWYTPEQFIAAARATLGLTPAATAAAGYARRTTPSFGQ